MRELKFRAYIKDSYPYFRRDMEKIVEVKSIHLNSQSIIITAYHGNVSVPFEYVEIMQFTELTDFKHKEIYEGDLVEIIGDEFYSNDSFSIDRTEGKSWKIVGEVLMGDFMWLVELPDKTWIPFCDIISNDFEINIIGNIYETVTH